MKKFAKVMAVALVAVMALALLVSCGPASDPDKALAALKENGYAAAAKLTDAISLGAADAIVSATRGDITAIVKATKTDDNDNLQTITIWYFKNAEAAKNAAEKAEEYANAQKGNSTSWEFGHTGAMIYWGTSAAIKAAR